MAESLSTSLLLNLTASLSNAVDDGTATFPLSLPTLLNASLTSGNSTDQANQLYAKQTTLTAGSNLTLSLHDFASAVDQLGQTRSLTKLKALALVIQGSLNNGYVSSAAVNAAGTGYLVDDILVVAGGTGTAAKIHVRTVGGGGNILTVSIEPYAGFTGGSYTANPTTTANAVTGGTGTGATMDLTMATYSSSNNVFIDADTLTLGGDGATSALTSLFGTNADKYIIPSGSRNLPGAVLLTSGDGGWTIGASTTNKNIKIVNAGSNPITFHLIIVGAT